MVDTAKQRISKLIEDGKLRPGQVEAKVLDIQDLQGIDDASCDLLTSAHAYPFCPDQTKAIAEANRVLKAGGIFGVVVWKSFELLPLAGQLMGTVTGKPPAAPPAGSPPPPPVAWGSADVTDKL